MSAAEREPEPCLFADMSGPVRSSHLLCRRPKGHEGPHMNELYEWKRLEDRGDGDDHG